MRAAALAGAGALLLSGCGIGAGASALRLPGGAGSGGGSYAVTVEFPDVMDLVPQSAVKVGGVPVGQVRSVSLDGWHADVRLAVSDRSRLPANAVAELRQTSPLGEKYVALEAPTGQPARGVLRNGDRIPLSRTTQDVSVEQVLSALSALLNGGGVAQLHTISAELNSVLGGRTERTRDLLQQLDGFVGGIDRQRSQIVRALQGMDQLSARINRESGTVDQALDTLPQALRILADQRRQLTGMITSLNRFGDVGTRVINASQQDLLGDLADLRPILTRLNQVGKNLIPALDILVTFPIPQEVVGAMKGDYINTDATVDLDFTTLYRTVVGGLVDPRGGGSGSGGSGSGSGGSGSGGSGSGGSGGGLLGGLPGGGSGSGSGSGGSGSGSGGSGPGSGSGGLLCPLVCDSGYRTGGDQAALAGMMTRGMDT